MDHRQGSQRDFSSFAFINLKKKREHFRQRLVFSMKLERLGLLTADICESWLQGLLGCEPEVSKPSQHCMALKCFTLLQQSMSNGQRSNLEGRKISLSFLYGGETETASSVNPPDQ